MSRKNTTSPYTANAFTNNPPTGGITPFTTNAAVTGYIASSGSFGVAVQAFEVGGRAFIALYRMYGGWAPITLTYHTFDGTAVAGVDYTAVSGTVTWGFFDTSTKIITVPLLKTSKTVSQFFNFSIDGTRIGAAFFPSVYYFTGGNILLFPRSPTFTILASSFQVNIIRPGNGEADFVGTPYSVNRPGGTTTLTVQVQRFTAFRGAVTVNFHTTDGTAIAGTAYTAQSGTLSWADGEGGTKNIVITILNGGSGTQSFTVTIDTPTGGVTIGSTNIATVNILPAAAPPNPTPGGSIKQQLGDVILPADPTNSFEWKRNYMEDQLVGYFRANMLFGGILANKIGSFIGFGPGMGSFGGGTDPIDGSPFFVPLSRFKFQGYMN